MIEKRTHTAGSDLEAVRIVKENFHISAPIASGFSLSRKDGMEICRWFKTTATDTARGEGRRGLHRRFLDRHPTYGITELFCAACGACGACGGPRP
jgi:hypothetical protein